MCQNRPTISLRTRRHRCIVLAFAGFASVSCASYYILSAHHAHLVALVLKRRRPVEASSRHALGSDGHLENPSIEVVLNDSAGLIVEITSPRDSEEFQSTTLAHSSSIDPDGLRHAYSSEPKNASFTPRGHLELKSNGIATKDSHGLLVEVAAELGPVQHLESSHSANSTNDITEMPLKQTKIINGISTPRSAYPFIVRLHSSNPGDNPDDVPYFFYCGGTLISPDVILTAAHCTGDEAYVDIYSLEEQKTKSYKIAKSEVHPMYESAFFGHDFALIKIERPHVEVVTVGDGTGGRGPYWSLVNDYLWNDQPPMMRLHRYEENSASCISLSRAESVKVTTLKVLGYGRTSFPDGPVSYSSLRSADVNYLLSEVCNEKYLKAPPNALAQKAEGVVVTDDMLCANDNENKQDACAGDSGGPLLAQLSVSESFDGDLWSLVGVVSWGIGCGLPEYPGVYSRVAEEIEWIESTICNKENGLSPLSCIPDRYGQMHLRDYAMEASVKRRKRNLANRQAGSRTMARDHHFTGLSRDRIHLHFSFSTTGSIRQSLINKKACELLAGAATTSEPTLKPSSHPKKGRPSKVGLGMNIYCSPVNKSDVRFFVANDNSVHDCFWVKSKCKSRCTDYSSCCPETCSQERCKSKM
ncbi:hypothetical protein ACHAWX_004595 [Stephanocyclus meneghinianus]